MLGVVTAGMEPRDLESRLIKDGAKIVREVENDTCEIDEFLGQFFSRRPFSRGFRPFIGPIWKAARGEIGPLAKPSGNGRYLRNPAAYGSVFERHKARSRSVPIHGPILILGPLRGSC